MCTAGEWRDAVTGVTCVTVKDSIAIMAGNAGRAGSSWLKRRARDAGTSLESSQDMHTTA